MARHLTADATAAIDSTPETIFTSERLVYRLAQVVITVAGTVLLQGRLAPDLPWHTLETFTSSDARSVAMFREMRFSVTGNTGAVSAHIDS